MKSRIGRATPGMKVRMPKAEAFYASGASFPLSRRAGQRFARIFGRPRKESPLQEMPRNTIEKIQGGF